MPSTSEAGWCSTLPTQPKIWDATRLSAAMRCWRFHYLATIRGLRGEGSVHIEFGSLYHGAVEELDTLLLQGVEHEEAVRKAYHNLLKASWDGERGQPWGGEFVETWQCTSPAEVPQKRDPSKMTANRQRCVHARMASPVAPVVREDPNEATKGALYHCAACGLPAIHRREYQPYDAKKNRASLLRAFLVYADSPEAVELYRFPPQRKCPQPERCQQQLPGVTECWVCDEEPGLPAVEVQGRIPLPIASPDGDPYELLVNIDSIVTWEGELAIRERKTTGLSLLSPRYWDQFNPNVQIDTYDLYASIVYADEDQAGVRVLVEAMEIGANHVRLRRMPIRVPAGRREEWFRELQQVIKEAERRADLATGTNLTPEECFPKNQTACVTPYGMCQFAKVCRLAPEAREELIAGAFRVERWDPLRSESVVETGEGES